MTEKNLTTIEKKLLKKEESLKKELLKTSDLLQEYIALESSVFRQKGEYEKIYGSQDVRFKIIQDMRFYAHSLR